MPGMLLFQDGSPHRWIGALYTYRGSRYIHRLKAGLLGWREGGQHSPDPSRPSVGTKKGLRRVADNVALVRWKAKQPRPCRLAAAYARLADHLSGAQSRRLTIELAAIAAGTGWQEGLDESQHAALPLPIEAFAANILTRRHRRVMRRGLGVVPGLVTAETTHGRKRLARAWKQFRKQQPFWG